MTLGLLSFGVLLAGFGETQSVSAPGVMSCRVRGVAGDFFRGTSKEMVLHSKLGEWQSELEKIQEEWNKTKGKTRLQQWKTQTNLFQKCKCQD